MEKKDFIVWASKLQADYQPSEAVKAALANVHLVAMVGPTGAGKSTLMTHLGLPTVLSDVTRDPRPGEKNHRNYHFRKDYLAIIDEIKQGNYAQFLVSSSGEFYGTRIDAYPREGSCTMAIVASAIPHFETLGFQKITKLYIMPPSYIEWMRRIGGVRTQDLLYRISEARDSILMALEDDSYYFILNDTVEQALQDIRSVLDGKQPSERRSQLARDTIDLLLEHIGDD